MLGFCRKASEKAERKEAQKKAAQGDAQQAKQPCAPAEEAPGGSEEFIPVMGDKASTEKKPKWASYHITVTATSRDLSEEERRVLVSDAHRQPPYLLRVLQPRGGEGWPAACH
eukprot:jgi/Mesvir1/10728/Mv13802-RA.1